MVMNALQKMRFACLALPLTLGAGTSHAQEPGSPGVSIELSAATTENAGCRMSFLIHNRHPQDITGAVYETVLFGDQGQVAQMTLLDFEDLPAGRPRVRQFRFDGMSCDSISRVLINGAENCTAPGLDPKACDTGLELKSMTKTELIG